MRSQLGFSSSDRGYLHSRLSCWWDGSLCVWQRMIFMNVSPTPVSPAAILMYLYLDGNRCSHDNSAWCKHFVCATCNTESVRVYNTREAWYGVTPEGQGSEKSEYESETGSVSEQVHTELSLKKIISLRVFQWYPLMYSADHTVLNNALHWYSNSSTATVYTVASHNNRTLTGVKASQHVGWWKTMNNGARIQVI